MRCFSPLLLLPVLLLSLAGCGPRRSVEPGDGRGFVIEVLRHGDEGPEELREVTDVMEKVAGRGNWRC